MVWKAIKFLIKNIGAFVAGSIVSLIILWLFIMKFLLYATIPKDNVGSVLAGAIILPIFYSIFAVIIGGILGIIIYNIARKKSKFP